MNLEVKPVVMLALIAGLVWYIGRQPPRPTRERVKRDDAPPQEPEPSAQRLETPRNGTRVRAWDTPIVEN